MPFLHLRGGDVNTICLATTTHRKVDVEGGQTMADITLGDDVEGRRVVKNVVVEREFTTGYHQEIS